MQLFLYLYQVCCQTESVLSSTFLARTIYFVQDGLDCVAIYTILGVGIMMVKKREVIIKTMKVGHRADRNAKMFCGGVAVFPRSHWIIHDRIANSTSDQLSFPQPCDVPAAAPTEVLLLEFLPIVLWPLF